MGYTLRVIVDVVVTILGFKSSFQHGMKLRLGSKRVAYTGGGVTPAGLTRVVVGTPWRIKE